MEYYDDGTVYEDNITFAQVIDEINREAKDLKEARDIWNGLVKDLFHDYIRTNF